MASNQHLGSGTLLGTVGGTALTVLVNVNSSDIAKTAILAAIGAAVSFTVSLLLKWLVKKLKK
ncbi:MAG: hypothetical protein ACT4ON_01065 [Bacteroidota bacterium]